MIENFGWLLTEGKLTDSGGLIHQQELMLGDQ